MLGMVVSVVIVQVIVMVWGSDERVVDQNVAREVESGFAGKMSISKIISKVVFVDVKRRWAPLVERWSAVVHGWVWRAPMVDWWAAEVDG